MTAPTKHGSSAHSHTLQSVLGSFLWPKGQWFSHQGIAQEAVEIKDPLNVFFLVARHGVALHIDFPTFNFLWDYGFPFLQELINWLKFVSYAQFFFNSQNFPPHPSGQTQLCLPRARHLPLFLHGFLSHPKSLLASSARFLSCQGKKDLLIQEQNIS